MKATLLTENCDILIPAALEGVINKDNAKKIKSKLNWKPQYPSLETIVDHAWKWHRKRHK